MISVDISCLLPKGKASVENLREKDCSLKLFIARWLQTLNSVKTVYEEAKNRHYPQKLHAFKVRGSALSPDLLIQTSLRDEEFWMALELKVCNEHLPLLNAYDDLLSYFVDYVALGASYEAGGVQVPIHVFAVATNYSPLGYLFKGEGKFDADMISRWKAYPVTTTYGRVLFHQRSRIRQTLDTLIQLPRGTELLSEDVRLCQRPLPHLGVLFHDPGRGRAQLLYSDTQCGYRAYFS